jgi:hypothetical protein
VVYESSQGKAILSPSTKEDIEAFDAWAGGLSKLCIRIRIAIEHHKGVLIQVAK